MSGLSIGLLCLSITAGVVIIVALITPGWLGYGVSVDSDKITVSMGAFYTLLCYSNRCDTYNNNEGTRDIGAKISPTRYTIEASLSLISVLVGTIFTAVFAVLLIRSERNNSHEPHCFKVIAIAGFVCNIIGVVFGVILCGELLTVHAYLDTISPPGFKSFPYSIMLMVIGLVMEVITMILTGFNLRSMPRENGGTVLSPASNTAFVVVQQPSSTPVVVQHPESVPMKQFVYTKY